MAACILILVVVAALLAIVSGVWVAVALIAAISVRRPASSTRYQPENESSD